MKNAKLKDMNPCRNAPPTPPLTSLHTPSHPSTLSHLCIHVTSVYGDKWEWAQDQALRDANKYVQFA